MALNWNAFSTLWTTYWSVALAAVSTNLATAWLEFPMHTAMNTLQRIRFVKKAVWPTNNDVARRLACCKPLVRHDYSSKKNVAS